VSQEEPATGGFLGAPPDPRASRRSSLTDPSIGWASTVRTTYVWPEETRTRATPDRPTTWSTPRC